MNRREERREGREENKRKDIGMKQKKVKRIKRIIL